MTKHELAGQLAQAERISHTKAVSIIENVADLIICHFQNGGEKITIRGFATIKVRKRRAFTGKDPHGRLHRHEEHEEKKSIIIRPSAEMLRRIN